MQLKHIKTLLPAQDGAAKICSIAWSLNNKKLGVCTYDRVVFLFDEFGEVKDKFSTRPCDPKYGKKSYMVKCLAFSPDATKIAVGQTDNILFVYKIGEDWGEKKTICNKFIYNGAVTCLTWLPDNQLIYGTAEGKVRLANTRTNKSSTLYDAKSYSLVLASNPSGKAILSGHADGSIVKFIVTDDGNGETSGKVCIHPSPPYALAWGTTSFLAAGCDKRVFVYSKEGRIVQQFDYGKDRENEEKEFTCAVCSPSGQTVVIGSFDRMRVYNWSPRKGLWDEGPAKEIKNLYTITALAWKADGSKLYAGSLCGAVEVFDCCLKKNIYKNKFEISYVGVSQVVIKSLVGKQSLNLKSRHGSEITEVKIVGGDRYVLGHTTDTLILADMFRKTSCEVPWSATGGNEKYSFDNENVCIISNAGELTLIEHGKNEILGSIRTEFTNKHLLSVRINERKRQDKKDNKKVAYLVDLKTIAILDLVTGVNVATINHDFKIGWLELNETGHKLLFRDQKLKLHLYDVESQTKTTILNYCSYVQWVPGSDVVVAQSREDLFIWYNIETPEKVTTMPIKGDVIDIERRSGKTEVVASDKGSSSSSSSSRYLLDEGMIEFRTAVDDGDFARAVAYLESLEMTPETEALWERLSNLSMEAKELLIAERCYAALGDVAKARHLNEINAIAKESCDQVAHLAGTSFPSGILWYHLIAGGFNNYKVQAKMALLDKNFKLAESIYLDQNNVDEAIKMYQELHKWEDAITVAEAMNHPELETLRKKFYLWTMESGQEHKAADMKERSGDYEAALQLYIKAGLPARAAKLLTSQSELMRNPDLIQRVTSALVKAEMFDKAGELFEKLGKNESAIEYYCKAHCYQKAVELARNVMPQNVVKLEEDWGNYLVSQKRYDSAINHFIESGSTVKALEASINSRQWAKATQILEVLSDRTDVKKYHLLIAKHFIQIGDYQEAEKLLVAANCINEAIEMYSSAGKWDQAHMLATKHMDIEKVSAMSLNQAKILEEKGKLREAEKLYVTIDKTDEAISMYKKHRMYEDMLRVVKSHRPNHVKDTHIYLAKLLESEGKLRLAEHHLLEAKDIDSAIRLYAKEDKWEEAYRVAKSYGGPSQQQRVAYEWSRSLGGESALKLLNKLGMLESTLNLALKSIPPDFEFAFELAKGKDKMPYVSEKYAEYLEENGRYREAEAEFIKAGIPKNAVLMYVSCKDWDSAQRVAELYDKSSVSDVMTAQGHVAFESGEFQKAESFFLRAQRPTLIVQRYKEVNMWADAIRVCKEYLPNILPELQNEFESKHSNESIGSNIQSTIERAQEFEAKGEYARAVKSYVDVTSQSPDDVILIEKCYKKATQLSLKFLSQENLVRVVEVVGPRLVELKRFNGAAELYLQADMIKEAITAFISGEEWTKAKKVAVELEPKLLPYVEKKYKAHLKEKDNLDVLESVDVEAALRGHITKGDWNKALTVAENKSPELLPKYVAEFASKLIQENKLYPAIELFVRYGTSGTSKNLVMCKKLFYEVVNLQNSDDKESFRLWSGLRDVFYDLNKQSEQLNAADVEVFQNMFLVSHYYATKLSMLGHESLLRSTSKISVSLLRHIDLIPADKAFFEAGRLCRETGQEDFALILSNNFLDIVEAIEEQSSTDLCDHPLITDTDIPSDFPLPQQPHVSASELEEVKEWVLAMSVDQKLPSDDYPRNDRGFYVGGLVDPRSMERFKPCVLTGFPVLDKEVVFKKEGYQALKEDWNKFITAIKTTRSPELCNVFEFIGEWCGIPQQHTTGVSMD